MSLKESEHIEILCLILAYDRLQISTILYRRYMTWFARYSIVDTVSLVQVKRVKETVIFEYYFVKVF